MKVFYIHRSNPNQIWIGDTETDTKNLFAICNAEIWVAVTTFPNKVVGLTATKYYVYDMDGTLLNNGNLNAAYTRPFCAASDGNTKLLMHSYDERILYEFAFNQNDNTLTVVGNNISDGGIISVDIFGNYATYNIYPLNNIYLLNATNEVIKVYTMPPADQGTQIWGGTIYGDYMYVSFRNTKYIKAYKFKNGNTVLDSLEVLKNGDIDYVFNNIDVYDFVYPIITGNTMLMTCYNASKVYKLTINPTTYYLSVDKIMTALNTIWNFQNMAPEYGAIEINACFNENTLIKTNIGDVKISELDPLKHMIDNKKIVKITSQILLDTYVILIQKNAIGENIPDADLLISQDHLVKYNNEMTTAKELLNKNLNVIKKKYIGEKYYNILLEKYDIIKVHNLEVETLHPDNIMAKFFGKILTDDDKLDMIYEANAYSRKEDWVKFCKKLN